MTAPARRTGRALFGGRPSRPPLVGDVARIAKTRHPSAAQLFRVLRGPRLVRDRREGTRRYYSAAQEGLAELRRYIEKMWDDVLGAYAAGDPNPPTKSTATSAKKRGAR